MRCQATRGKQKSALLFSGGNEGTCCSFFQRLLPRVCSPLLCAVHLCRPRVCWSRLLHRPWALAHPIMAPSLLHWRRKDPGKTRIKALLKHRERWTVEAGARVAMGSMSEVGFASTTTGKVGLLQWRKKLCCSLVLLPYMCAYMCAYMFHYTYHYMCPYASRLAWCPCEMFVSLYVPSLSFSVYVCVCVCVRLGWEGEGD